MTKDRKRSEGSRKSVNYDMVGIFVQLCFNMGLKQEEMHGNYEELRDYVDELHKKIEELDKELQQFRNCLKT